MRKTLATAAIWIFSAGFFLGATATACAQISLSSTVDLALRDSNKVRVAAANVQRARGSLSELHASYIPSLTVGAGLGYSFGFPLGTPTLFNAYSTSLIYSAAQSEYIRSSRASLQAATFSLQDARQQVILDIATAYFELDKVNHQIAALNEASADADQLVSIVQDRVAAGMDSRVEETTARLTRAQMNVQQLQLQDQADELRQHISNLTGLPANSLSISSSSIPPLPATDISTAPAITENPALEASLATDEARSYSARGDQRQSYLPTLQQQTQYSLFSTFNNYQNYYTPGSFQQNNFGFQVGVVWPLFDPIHRAKNRESNAEALSAQRQTDQAKMDLTAQNLTLWHHLRELKAQQQVAALQQELAQDTLNSILTQMKTGSGSANAPAVTPQQAEQSRIDERNRYIALLNADFAVQRIQLQLLRATGQLENWATGQK